MMHAHVVIAEVLGCNAADVYEGRYQSGRTRVPVYVVGDNYYCAPTAQHKPPKDFPEWKSIGWYKEREVFEAVP